VLLLIAGAVVAVVSNSGSDKSKTASGASVASDCGANIGKDGPVAAVSYVQSNIAAAGKNSVIMIPYHQGDMKPLAMSQCSTGGSGSTDLTDSGVLDANDQVITNPQHTLLFSANQGSDTIAVFHIQPNGGLQPVAGSPFPSNGKGPSSLGLSGNTLVVSNKAQDGVRDLKNTSPNYTTFNVAADGRLTPVAGSSIDAKPGSSPTDASVPPQGGVAFGTEESGPIRSFAISNTGVLKQAPGSPQDPPAQIFAPGYDPAKVFALGVGPHPSKPLVYIGMPTIPALAVYSYDQTGKLTFVDAVLVAGAYLPCWIQITKDGHWLYTSNADTNNVTAFDISNPTKPKQIQTLAYQTPGNPWNIQIDPSGRFLIGITPRDTFKTPEGEGNTMHVMSIGADGKLTELNAASPAKIPVPKGTNPQGIAVVNPGS
jgi:6-phosphogluconolactonase (cycloisomerase 2 family)